jgi:hypothetical protein
VPVGLDAAFAGVARLAIAWLRHVTADRPVLVIARDRMAIITAPPPCAAPSENYR